MKVAIQLYSVKETMKKDPVGTIKKVSDIGYKALETFAHPSAEGEKSFGLEMTLAEAKSLLDETGLKIAGGHYYYLGNENFEKYCEYYASLGAKQVGSGGDFFPGGIDELKEKMALMVEDAKIAKKHGLKYYYHNHFWEYQMFGNKNIMEIMADETPEDLIYFEIDNYWAMRGGADPVKETERLGSREILMHQKDFAKDAGEPINLFEFKIDPEKPIHAEDHRDARHVGTFAEVGNGILPIQDYIDAGNKIGVEYVILEQDLTKIDEIESIKISMSAFKKFTGLEW
jgi:sugar phosphate isomerase/epimerase